VIIRSARIADVAGIHLLVKRHSEKAQLLPRSLFDLYEKLQEFVVAVEEDAVVACGALHICWEDLAEVRTLVVAENFQGRGLGKKMVRTLEKRAEDLGIKKMFALSFLPEFFKNIGYAEIDKENLPQKVWRDCINCPLFPDCGETALMIELVSPAVKA